MARPLASLLLLTTLLVASTGCAVFDEDNRRLVNLMDDRIQPESTAARIALAPVVVPAATVALAGDAVLTHPAHQVAPAWDDVYQLYWKPREIDPLRKAILFPLCVVLTPPSFAGDWLMRSIFDFD